MSSLSFISDLFLCLGNLRPMTTAKSMRYAPSRVKHVGSAWLHLHGCTGGGGQNPSYNHEPLQATFRQSNSQSWHSDTFGLSIARWKINYWSLFQKNGVTTSRHFWSNWKSSGIIPTFHIHLCHSANSWIPYLKMFQCGYCDRTILRQFIVLVGFLFTVWW